MSTHDTSAHRATESRISNARHDVMNGIAKRQRERWDQMTTSAGATPLFDTAKASSSPPASSQMMRSTTASTSTTNSKVEPQWKLRRETVKNRMKVMMEKLDERVFYLKEEIESYHDGNEYDDEDHDDFDVLPSSFINHQQPSGMSSPTAAAATTTETSPPTYVPPLRRYHSDTTTTMVVKQPSWNSPAKRPSFVRRYHSDHASSDTADAATTPPTTATPKNRDNRKKKNRKKKQGGNY
jgi:hypothetical protein